MGSRYLAHSLSDRSEICCVMLRRGADNFRFLLRQRRKNSWTSPGQLLIRGTSCRQRSLSAFDGAVGGNTEANSRGVLISVLIPQ